MHTQNIVSSSYFSLSAIVWSLIYTDTSIQKYRAAAQQLKQTLTVPRFNIWNSPTNKSTSIHSPEIVAGNDSYYIPPTVITDTTPLPSSSTLQIFGCQFRFNDICRYSTFSFVSHVSVRCGSGFCFLFLCVWVCVYLCPHFCYTFCFYLATVNKSLKGSIVPYIQDITKDNTIWTRRKRVHLCVCMFRVVYAA